MQPDEPRQPDTADARFSAPFDAAVVGGGPAGLSAAVQLARLGRSCVVVDDDAGRSLWRQVTRNYLGFPEGIDSADLRLLGQTQAARYGAVLCAARVTDVARVPDGFALRLRTAARLEEPAPGAPANRGREARHGRVLGEWRPRRGSALRAHTVILATGVRDRWPAFAGRDECIGRSLFWCIVCDGYEARGRRVVVIGDDASAVETALGLRRLTSDVVLVTGRPSRSAVARARFADLERAGVDVRRARVVGWRHTAGDIEALDVRPVVSHGAAAEVTAGAGAAAATVAAEMVFVSVPKRPRNRLARALGAATDHTGYVCVDEHGATDVPGVYAAGDVTAGRPHQVSAAVEAGARAATAANWFLYRPVERGEG